MILLNNPVWPFIGVIGTLLTVVIPLILIKKRNIGYFLKSNTRILGVDEEKVSKLDFQFNGKSIKSPQLIEVLISNIGNSPIKTSDFESDILITFNKESEVLSVEAIETNPKELKIDIDHKTNEVMIKPVLLNPNESFVLRILINKFKENINIHGRIVGISGFKEIRKYNIKIIFYLISFYLSTDWFFKFMDFINISDNTVRMLLPFLELLLMYWLLELICKLLLHYVAIQIE